MIATRALQLDRWTREFLDAHRTAVVLNLGCGLDSRAERIAPPSSAVWVDLDRPEMIALRQRLYAEQDRTLPIVSSVTDSAWWNEGSSDRPVSLLAEGLFMYLTSDDVAGVLRAATERIARGRVAFDAVAPWVVRASALQPAMRQPGTRFRSGLPSVSILEREHPRLRIRDELSFVELLLEQPLTASYRAMLTLLRRLPGFRNAMRLVQFDMRPI